MPDFPGQNEKRLDSICVWANEEAVLAYQLKWINELNYTLFPKEYDTHPAFKALRSLVYGDNYNDLNRKYYGYTTKNEGVTLGLKQNIIIKQELKKEKIAEAKKVLADLKKFYDENAGSGKSIYQKNCQNMSVLSDADKQQNLLYMVGNSPYGDSLLYSVTKSLYPGHDPKKDGEEKVDESLNENIINYKSNLLTKTVQELGKSALEYEGKLDEIEQNSVLYKNTNSAIIKYHNKINLFLKPKKNDEGQIINDGKNKDREVAKNYLNLRILGSHSPNEIFEKVKSENQGFKANWQPEDIHIKILFDTLEKQIRKTPDYKFLGLYEPINYSEVAAENAKRRVISKLNEIKSNYEKAVKEGQAAKAETKLDLIDEVDNLINNSHLNKGEFEWYWYRSRFEDIKKRLYDKRADVVEARNILKGQGRERTVQLIDVVTGKKYDTFNRLLEIYENLDTEEKQIIYNQMVEEKGRVYDELLEDVKRNIPELNLSYMDALRTGRFGDLPEKNKETIVKKMSARLALTASPEKLQKLNDIDFLLKKFRENGVDNNKAKEKEILAQRENNPDNGPFYQTLQTRDQDDPELQDVRLVVENIGGADRIAVAVSKEEKERAHQNALSKYRHVLKWASYIRDIHEFASKNLSMLKLDDKDMESRRVADNDYNKIIEGLSKFKIISPDSTPNQIKITILNTQMAIMDYKETLRQKEQNHTITDVEKEIKNTISDIEEKLSDELAILGNQLTDMGGQNPGDISYKEHISRKYAEFKKTRPGTTYLDIYLKNTEYYNEALRLTKLEAKKALKDMKADKSGNSKEFEALKDALIKVSKLDMHSSFTDVMIAIKEVETSATVYVEKSERQIHPFGEPKRTTIARGLSTFTAGIHWEGEQNVPGRPSVEDLLENPPRWADPNQSIGEQAIELKNESLKESEKRASDAKIWEDRFFNTFVPAVWKLGVEVAKGENQLPEMVGDDYKFGRDKQRDKLILAGRLKEVDAITKKTPIKEIISRLNNLKKVADKMSAAGKDTLAQISKQEFPKIAEVNTNLPDVIKVKARDISALAGQMISGFLSLEISAAEMAKSMNELTRDRATNYGKLNDKERDAFKRGDEVKQNANIRANAHKL